MAPKKNKAASKFESQKFLELFQLKGITGKGLGEIKTGQVLTNPQTQTAANYISVKLLRPQDLLSMELRFTNFALSGNKLVKKADPALMMVLFQSQSIAEECGLEKEDGLYPPVLPAKMLLSGDSRLVFKVNKSSLSLDVNDLLNWEDLEIIVNKRARGSDEIIIQPVSPQQKKNIDKLLNNFRKTGVSPIFDIKGVTKDERMYIKQKMMGTGRKKKATKHPPKKEAIAPPGEWETSLEIPFRLYLSPTVSAGWKHEISLKSKKGIIKNTDELYELWHTRMGTKTKNGIDDSDFYFEERLLRILWGETINEDYKKLPAANDDETLGNTSTNDFDRHEIVHESSNFSIKHFVPQPVKVHKLFLTTLGATLDSIFEVERNKLPADKFLSLLKWRHIQSLAREHYVEFVYAGNIMPFGHKAVLIKITERKPHKSSVTATNFKREIVIITEHVKHYNYRNWDGDGNIFNFCFSKVEILNTASNLIDGTEVKLEKTMGDEQFIIKDVQFKIHAEDLNGNTINFLLPLVFVGDKNLTTDSDIQKLIDAYNISNPDVKKDAELNGQKLSLAPPEVNACDTAFAAYNTTFNVKKYSSADEPQGFLPTLYETSVIEPSYKRLTGKGDKITVSLIDDTEGNAGRVFAKITSAPGVDFGEHADKTGGLARPNFNLTGLSKVSGAFGGNIDNFKNAAATASDYFHASTLPDPVLFGVFKLSDILNFPAGDTKSYDLTKPLLNRAPKIPNLITEETTDKIITSYVIKPDLQSWSAPGNIVSFIPGSTTDGFSIVTQTIVNKNSAALPIFSTEAKMGAFDIGLMDDLLKIKFQQVKFTSSPGKSADVNIDMKNPSLEFGGPLSFINAFQKLIPPGGFSDPPYLDVSATGVKCGYTLALPNLQMGAFTLANLSLGAEVNLPFSGGPLVMGFRFCEKQQPFTLTVSFLGGGGYFGFEADLNGLRQIDAALEFGAAVALNLGVASGSVSVMAGIYFKLILTNGEGDTQLTGYLRINGAMSILGLITATVELYLAFTYLVDTHKAYGEASVSIKVHVVFFNKSVTVHASRTFAGSGSDPNFQLTYSPDSWREYCEAFAA